MTSSNMVIFGFEIQKFFPTKLKQDKDNPISLLFKYPVQVSVWSNEHYYFLPSLSIPLSLSQLSYQLVQLCKETYRKESTGIQWKLTQFWMKSAYVLFPLMYTRKFVPGEGYFGICRYKYVSVQFLSLPHDLKSVHCFSQMERLGYLNTGI